jgi:hypothetical protein
VTTAAPATLLVLAPTVNETTDQIWSISPASVSTHVSASGTFGQPAHVAIQMMYVQGSPFGCRTVDWHDALLNTTGPPVAVPADNATIVVPSGRTPKLGCYAPVPRLTMDANPAVVALGPLGSANDIISAGLDANAKPVLLTKTTTSTSDTNVYVTAAVFAAILGAAVAATIHLARKDTS